MTRRIAIAILLTVWLLLIGGGLLAYYTTRSVLLTDMDASLVRRAAALAASTSPRLGTLWIQTDGDRYLVKNDLGQTIIRPSGTGTGGNQPQLLAAFFSNSTSGRMRTVTVRVPSVEPVASAGSQVRLLSAITVTYSTSAQQLDSLLNRLAITLVVFGLICGLLTAGVAQYVSRAALRPLEATAQQIEAIDEQTLDRRIDVLKLPSELLPMAERLNALLHRLDDAFSRRTRFLADASHELRTPVASLVTAIEVALRHPRSEEQYRQTLQTCCAESKTLRQLVEKLMEQVRGEQTASDEPIEVIDAAHLLEGCLGTAMPIAVEKDVTLARKFTGPMPHSTQPSRLRSIVINLLSNAIEYNRPGGRVELGCHLSGDGGLHLRVTDTGIGIAPQDLPRLFEPFYRADSAHVSSGHLGLGLSLVQTHVHALHGNCQVESSPDGTTFHIHLPANLVQRRRKSA